MIAHVPRGDEDAGAAREYGARRSRLATLRGTDLHR
jgi:hypothetical protein